MTIDTVGVNQYINTHLFIPRLCNGSTSDSGSDCGGSNPPWGTYIGPFVYRLGRKILNL